MGRLSEYINGSRGRSAFIDSGGKTQRNGDVEVSGFIENSEMLGRLMTEDPYMAANLKKLIREVLKEARARLSKDIAGYLEHDPRKAARAVKYGVYKSLFGGNLSILTKRKAGAKYELIHQKTLQSGQRGGNRRPRVPERNRLDYYYGSDRSFILRFLSSGTIDRQTRYGSRGSISQRDLFGRTAPWQMETAAQEVAAAITEYIKKETNG